MATIGDVLRHLVANSSGVESMGNRQELFDAIDAEYPPPTPAEPTAVEDAYDDPKEQELVKLRAELAELRAVKGG